ncbi:MAG: hypothetical protein ACREXM_19570, partial [Gammaproteobacteria bacterium]
SFELVLIIQGTALQARPEPCYPKPDLNATEIHLGGLRQSLVRHRLGFVAALLVAGGVIVFLLVATDYFSVDACLDSGGRWDKEQAVCQHEEHQDAPR